VLPVYRSPKEGSLVSDSKVALVTGASRGIGRAIAIDLARHGFDVVPTARSLTQSVETWPGTLEETSERVRSYGQQSFPLKMDLLNQDEIRSGIDTVFSEMGRIDILVTSATYLDFAPDGTFLSEFVNTRWDALQSHIDINITSTLLLARLILPAMVERGSGIVMNITQNAAWLGMEGLPLPGQGMCGMAIPVTRGVTDRIAPALKREVGPHGVTVLTLDPGMTMSIVEERFPDTMQAGYLPDLAQSVLVAARAASYIATCRNPLRFNGEFVIAADLVREYGLLTEDEIMPPPGSGYQEVDSIQPLPGFPT
jgi:NAD(P)-dependent dehydrogenase (short-subunit alcohol dehydrogenase family)